MTYITPVKHMNRNILRFTKSCLSICPFIYLCVTYLIQKALKLETNLPSVGIIWPGLGLGLGHRATK